MTAELVFVKLGGSLITDKTRPETPRPDVIARLAEELLAAMQRHPELSIVLGHGSGSFGHWEASRYGTRDGVCGREAWIGFARVAASATRLTGIVTDTFLETGLPVLAIRPFPTARCRDGVLVKMDTYSIHRALEERLVPLVHGDVALDEVRGGTIASTEEIMAYLAPDFEPKRILLLGETAGVILGSAFEQGNQGDVGDVVPFITPENIGSVADSLGGARGRDVTGGMLSKVRQMLELVQRQPGLRVHILSGLQPGLLTRALLEDDLKTGTCIKA